MRNLFALILLVAVPALGQVPSEVIRAKWPAMAKAGNPFTTYGSWRLDPAQDPAWIAGRSIPDTYSAWLATGDVKFRDWLLEDRMYMPDVTTPQPDGSRTYVSHLHEISHVRDYLLIRELLPPERKAEWERRLKARAVEAIAELRIGDIDRCLNTAGYLLCLNKHLGTCYGKEQPVIEANKWLNEYMALDTFKGGPRDASSDYELSTYELACWVAAICGKDCWPWFDHWAKEQAAWLPWSVCQDYRDAVAWGDQAPDDGSKIQKWHRVQLCFLLSGLGYDENGALISLGRKLIGEPKMGEPASLYPYGGMAYQFVCDPERIMAAPHVPLQDGMHVAEGIGTTVIRQGDSFLFVNLSNSRRADGSAIPEEDHHYAGGFANFAWKYKGQRIVWQPYGYGIGSNEFFNLNSVCMKNDGWFWNRRFLGTATTAGGFTTSGEMFGPAQRFHHAIEPHQWPAVNAFDKCKVVSRIDFDGAALTVRDRWLSPGDTFPEWTSALPVFQRCQHALGPIKDDGKALTWKVGGIPVRVAYAMQDGDGNAVQPKVVVESEPRLLNGQNHYRAFIQSPPDLLNGSLELSIGPAIDTPEPGPPPDIPVRGVIRGKQLIIELP